MSDATIRKVQRIYRAIAEQLIAFHMEPDDEVIEVAIMYEIGIGTAGLTAAEYEAYLAWCAEQQVASAA